MTSAIKAFDHKLLTFVMTMFLSSVFTGSDTLLSSSIPDILRGSLCHCMLNAWIFVSCFFRLCSVAFFQKHAEKKQNAMTRLFRHA